MLKTSNYPYYKFDFEHFNVVQEACYSFFTEDCNMVISSAMASGKTAIAEAIMGFEFTKPSSKICYVSPLKALSNEKFDDWNKCETLKSISKVLLSGDTSATTQMIESSSLILSTVEALDVKVRKKSEWIKRLRCLIFDEAHLLGHSKRGADAEALLMGLTKMNQNCRIIILSGTLKNAKQLAQWLKKLNGKATKFVESQWTPIKINKHSVEYSSVNDLSSNIRDIVDKGFMDKKTLVFVHSKKLGVILTKYFLDNGYQAAFYHSDLDYKKRQLIAERFRDDFSGLNILVSTSALGMGMNL